MTVFVDHGASVWLYVVTLIAWIDACKYATLAIVAPFLWLAVVVRGLTDRRRAGLLPADRSL